MKIPAGGIDDGRPLMDVKDLLLANCSAAKE